MPQEFQVLRCCDCEKFQVHQVKKAKKWDCKVCGVKQSYIKVYFIGSSKECRVIVQKFNFEDGVKKTSQVLMKHSFDNSENYEEYEQNSSENIHKRFKKENIVDSKEVSDVISNLLEQDNSNSDFEPLGRTLFQNTTLALNTDSNSTHCSSGENSNSNTFISESDSLQKDGNESLVSKVSNHIKPKVKNMGFQKILQAAKRTS